MRQLNGPLTTDGASVWLPSGELVGTNLTLRGPHFAFDRTGIAGSGVQIVSARRLTRVAAARAAAPASPATHPPQVDELTRLRDRALSRGYTLEDLLAANARDGCAALRAQLDSEDWFGSYPAAYWAGRAAAVAPAPRLEASTIDGLAERYWRRPAARTASAVR